ncbi:MAG: calcium/sodium antiporter [Paludibacteraceae bacterium]|nr:calcium/sodium antiporter [Paludibacteraceae bacterium]
MTALVIVFGFVFLLLGAEGLVDGASGLAKRFGISNLVIGMTVVAFGTSMPEFVVNMLSVAEGQTDLALTNIVGSNIINIFVILGLTALVYPIASARSARVFDIPMNILAGVVVLVAVLVTLPFESTPGMSRLSGGILLLIFGIFMYHSVKTAKAEPDSTEDFKPMPLAKSLIYIVLGLAGLIVGGEMIVRGSVRVATELGVPDAIIGLTIVALGTSLPELATSVVAATKHNCDLALGNIVGSVSFNVFFILGTSALLRPLPAYEGIILDGIMATLGAVLVWLGVISNRQHQLKRWHGALLLTVYAAYLTYRLMNV